MSQLGLRLRSQYESVCAMELEYRTPGGGDGPISPSGSAPPRSNWDPEPWWSAQGFEYMPARGAQRSFIPQGEGREPHGQPRAPLVSSRRPLEPRPLLSVGEHGWAGPAPCTAPTEPGHEASQRRSAPQGEGFEPGSRLAQQRDGEAAPSLATATSSVTSGQQLDRCRSCWRGGCLPGLRPAGARASPARTSAALAPATLSGSLPL